MCIIFGFSSSGKTVLLHNLALDIHKGCFERIYKISPSIDVDTSWLAVKKYFESAMQVRHTDAEPIYVDHYDVDSLQDVLPSQHNITKIMKNRSDNIRFHILLIIDDFAYDPAFTRQSQTLFIRVSHNMINTIVATQTFNALHPIIRVHATELFVYRFRNIEYLDNFMDEVSVVVDMQALMEV